MNSVVIFNLIILTFDCKIIRIKTERLLIRNLELSDAQDIFELDTDPDVMRFIGKMPNSLNDSIATLERQFVYYKKNPGLGVYACELKDSKETTFSFNS